MTTTRILLITAVLSTLSWEATAWAGYDPDCSKLPKGDKAACEAKAKTECDSVEGYWPKRRCVSKVSKEFNLCLKDGTFEAMCVERKAAYWDICMKAGELDANLAATFPEFKRRALAYDETLKKAKDFEQEWGACYKSEADITADTGKCAVTKRDVIACEGAKAVFQKSQSDAINWYLDTTMPNTLLHLDSEMASKFFKAAKGSVASTLATIATLQELNRDVPMYAHRGEDLKKAVTKFQIIDGLIDKIEAETKAAVRCPKGTRDYKRLAKPMRKSVKQFFGVGTHAKKVKVFRLNGKKSVTIVPLHNEVRESYPAVACTEGLPKSQSAKVCQVFNVSVKRSKFRGERWGSWKTFVGHSEEMLCKNLK